MEKAEKVVKKTTEKKELQSFFFPRIKNGVTVQAETLEEAQEIANKL